MGMTTLRVGAIQLRPKLGDIEYNRRKILRFLQEAHRLEIDLVVLPELANSGYNFGRKDTAYASSEAIPEGETVKMLEKTCSDFGMIAVCGINERDGKHLYNSAVIVGPDGYVGKYRKVHLFYREKDIFRRGDRFHVFEVGSIRIGVMICFDWIFPEAARTLALQGADIIAHPVNLVLPYWQKVCPLRALENRVFIISANRVGIEGDLSFTGESIIVDPRGEIIARASRTHEEIIYADVDIRLARDKKITPRNHIFEDRVPEAYVL